MRRLGGNVERETVDLTLDRLHDGCRQPVAEEPSAGSAANVSSASSPIRISEISARVKPSTRRLANSWLRSDNETRAAL